MTKQSQVTHLHSHDYVEAEPIPAVGMGVTGVVWTDMTALTIVRVSKSGKVFWATEDLATLIPGWKAEIVPGGFVGHCENNYTQKYTYTAFPGGKEVRFTLGKNGEWKCSGRFRKVILGVRRAFYDYNF